ncbi:hypothetical protein ID866_8941 [Astraeus odoratus]|nr:hypothetical protein ID866_8941 [Astraeus odoratus]
MPQELHIALREITQCASRSSINLNGCVDRRDLYVRGASTLVYRGTLRPGGTPVAAKTILSGTPSSKKDIIEEVVRWLHTLSQVDHKHVLPLLGITTEFYFNISIVSAWMENGNAHDYVQEHSVDPRPLVSCHAC